FDNATQESAMKVTSVVEAVAGTLAFATLALGACSSGSGQKADGGGGPGGSGDATTTTDGGRTVKAFTFPAGPGRGQGLRAASGELLALTGYGFPPNPSDAPAFVDGWQVQFTRLLTTVDKVTLSTNPDVDPGNQELTGPPPGAVNGG